VSTAVLVLNFGEPDEPTLAKAQPYLERIFLENSGLEGHADLAAAVARARQLARDRAPGLVEEYERIGGSPLNAQAGAQARALEAGLAARGDFRVYPAFQFTDPTIADAVTRARADGADTVVALPVYPLCGHSTTAAALTGVRAALREIGWAPRLVSVAGWHHHPDYLELRTGQVRAFVDERGLDLDDPDTLLWFSVHGTPVRYLTLGGRYDRYVFEHCRDVARGLGAGRYGVGFQNHANRRIAWTQPDNEAALAGRAERRFVVVPISFMHEQSETLAELDHGLRGFLAERGKELERVPVPHDDPRFPRLLADLVLGALAAEDGPDGRLSKCRCCPQERTWCTNGARDLPPSPYVPADAAAGAAR
jgi:ferrochelatase